MARKQQKGRDLSRKAGQRAQRHTIVVFCEGVGTEPDYVNALKRLPDVAADTFITISDTHGMPKKLVDTAVMLKHTNREVDECWCLFDVEWPQHHPHLQDVVQHAKAVKGVEVAVSNPCFEVWLLMHYQDGVTGFLETDDAVQRSMKKDGRSGKRIDGSAASAYMSLRFDAIDRAKRLDERHRRNGTEFPDDNPSSGMYRFLEAIGADRPDVAP